MTYILLKERESYVLKKKTKKWNNMYLLQLLIPNVFGEFFKFQNSNTHKNTGTYNQTLYLKVHQAG